MVRRGCRQCEWYEADRRCRIRSIDLHARATTVERVPRRRRNIQHWRSRSFLDHRENITMLRRIAAILIVVGFFPISTNAHTHLAYDGAVVKWYPKACCNEGDCRAVRHEFVYGPGGLITHVKMFVEGAWRLYPIVVVRPSRDHLAHWCGKVSYYRGEPYLNEEYCKFAPVGQARGYRGPIFASSAIEE